MPNVTKPNPIQANPNKWQKLHMELEVPIIGSLNVSTVGMNERCFTLDQIHDDNSM